MREKGLSEPGLGTCAEPVEALSALVGKIKNRVSLG